MDLFFFIIVLIVLTANWSITHLNSNSRHTVGDIIDNFNDIPVYYNGGVANISGRNLTIDGYSLGLKYQCVEFIKRYYYQRFGHKMPNDKGNAKDFFSVSLPSGFLNLKRGLIQFNNKSKNSPKVEDIVAFAPWLFNRYGHVAIISKVESDYIEITQQNPGPFGSTREKIPLKIINNEYLVVHERLPGWLRMP